jgi:RNA polymerase sporulation-specific sigma factor
MAELEQEVSLGDLTDEELALYAQSGREEGKEAFETIIQRYRGFVQHKVRTYFLAGADHEDIVQEGMIGLYKAVKDFNGEKYSSFKTFAGVCITRQIITAVKTATRQKHIPLNSYVSLNKKVYDSEGTLAELIPETHPSDPETILIDQENYSGIEYKINRALSKLELQVLNYYLENRSYSEISELIHKDIKSVDNALQRIKKKVEALLKDSDSE